MGKTTVRRATLLRHIAKTAAVSVKQARSTIIDNPYADNVLGLLPLRPDGTRLIPKREMLVYVGGISWPAVWGWIRAGTFPHPRQVGSRVMWVEGELAAWLISRPVAVYKKPTEGDL